MARIRRWLRRLGLGLLGLLILVTIASFVYNLATNGREKPAAALYPGPFVDVNGTSVAYRTWGTTGSPIVLVGGFIEPSWVWHAVGPLLGRHHRVYALDLPPFGYTQRRGPYTLAGWVTLLDGFERQLHIEKPLVVGHSLGAAVAVAVALSHPDQTAGIVLLDGDALSAGGRAGWLAHLLIDPYYTSVYRLASSSDWLVRRGLRSAYGPHEPPLTQAIVDEWKRPFRVTGTRPAFRKLLSYGLQGFELSELGGVHVRSLVVWGGADGVDSVAAGRHSAAMLNAPFVLVPGAGHLSMLSHPAVIAATVSRFAG
jgi:pimeloyl-ACP methyl ester carboxylesterase